MQLARALALLASLPLLPAGAQTLVRDVNTTPVPDPSAFQSQPTELTASTGFVVFTARTPGTQSEPWVSDGTAAGTRLLADIEPGNGQSSPRSYARLADGRVVFRAFSTPVGAELWVTDGTPAGTSLLIDLAPGATSSSPSWLTAFAGEVYFSSTWTGNGVVWRTDGTAAGTQQVVDLGVSRPFELTASGSSLFIVADNNAAGTEEVWGSDGTGAGTTLLTSLRRIAFQSPSRAYGDGLVFEADDGVNSREPWFSDGTAAGTAPLGNLNPTGSSQPFDFYELNGTCYFTAEAQTNVRELWSTDGTPAGTRQLTNGLVSGDPETIIMGQVAGELVFSAGAPGRGGGLYRTDGTLGGEVRIGGVYGTCPTSCGVGAPAGGIYSAELPGLLVFAGRGDADPDSELWATDGTSLTRIELAPGAADSVPNEFERLGNQLLFRADTPSTGRELFTTDGTPAGTGLVADLYPAPVSLSSSPSVLGKLVDELFFVADDGTTGREPWVSDGTSAGTLPIGDLLPGPAGSRVDAPSFAATDRFAFFAARTPAEGREPWVSDGTPAGSHLLLDVLAGAGWSDPGGAEAVGERVFFDATDGTHGRELWVTDGSAPGTQLVKDLYPVVVDSDPTDLFAFDDRLLFTAVAPGIGRELFVTDGTAGGTQLLGDLDPGPGSSSPAGFARFGALVYFAATDAASGRELWRTDGSPAGTYRVADLTPGATGSGPRELVVAGERLFFVAQEIPGVQTKLWSDTGAGPRLVTTLPFSLNGPLHAVGPAVFFFQRIASRDNPLWRSDGTSLGTSVVSTRALALPFPPRLWSPGHDNLWFSADDGIVGLELWLTDGSLGGERVVLDVSPGSATPSDVLRLGPKVFFAADDGDHGRELHVTDLSPTDDWAREPYGTGCPGSNGVVPVITSLGKARASAAAPFRVRVEQARPSSAALLLVSSTRLDVPLGGCTLWVGPTFTTTVTPTDANGRGVVLLQASPQLVGSSAYFQYGVLDPGGALNGIASATGGLEVVIGP